MVVPPSFDYDDPTAHSPKRRRSRKKQQSSPRSLKGAMKQQHKSRRSKRGSSDNASTYTKSTASASGEWSNGSLKSSISSLKSSVSSLGTMGMNSPGGRYSMDSPGGGRVLMEPLNDLGMGSHHERASHSSLLSPSHNERGSHSSLMSASSNQTRDSVTSLGESSLSSFLSVLLEDEEAKPSEISIVSDNPKPEQKSVRDLRLSFIRSAYNSDKPKCRWEYLTRDNNDREKLARSTRRSKLETRSLSFSGAINETKQRLRRCSSNGSMNSVNSKTNKKKVSEAVEGMFLRMPVRKNSPMSAAATKKSLMSRVNMSDTDLVLLPMQPGTSSMTPKKTKRRSSRSSRSSRKSDKKSGTSKSKSLDEPESPQPKGLSRSGDRKANNRNATWSKEDTMREHRRRNSNEFLDFLLEPESDNKSGWPSPIPSPAFASPRKLALGISHRQLEGLSPSVFSLGDDSSTRSSSSSYEEDLKAIEIAAKKIPAPKRSSFSKQSNIKKHHPRRSSECSTKSSSGRTYHSTITLKGERTPEKCSSRPPQLPTRLKTPTTLYNSPSRKSPRATIRKNKNKKLTLPSCLPLSPRSPRSSSKKSVASTISKKSIASNPTDSPLSSPRTPTSKKSVIRQKLSSPKKSPKKIASKTGELPKAPVGKWYSPFDYDMNMDG